MSDADELFDPPETLAQKIKRFDENPFEASRMQSVFQNGRTCHTCSCHINPPCMACVDCETCNKEWS